MASVTIIFPHPAQGPTGGYKVMFEYANRLVADGWDVNVIYSGSVFFSKKTAFRKLTGAVKYIQNRLKEPSCRWWFPLDPRIKELFPFSMNYRDMPKSDIYIATSPYTAWYLNEYPIPNNRKIYFIQDKEDWGPGLRSILVDTYYMPLTKIVISQWLHKLLLDYDEESLIIPNGFDFDKFRLTNPIGNRDGMTVSMLYHEMERKDCATGLKALEIVKSKYPELKVMMFGTPYKPASMPDWIDYYQSPSEEVHLDINNTCAVFLGTSIQEGWGLTVGEAMACGQAVVCTDNPGYLEMAKNDVNALVVPVGDAEAMADAIIRLATDNQLRHRIAQQGHDDIHRFTWDTSYALLKDTLTKTLSLGI